MSRSVYCCICIILLWSSGQMHFLWSCLTDAVRRHFLWSCLTDAVRRHFLWSWLTDAVRRRAASLARPISRYCLGSCLTDAVRRRAASLARPISRYCAVVSIAKTISCPLLPCFLLRVYQPASKRG